MLGSDMKQQGGDASQNIQVKGDFYNGITEENARKIALDVFKANFCELSVIAAQKTMERIVEMNEKFLKKCFSEIPQFVQKLQEPSIQLSIFDVQKEYAKTGDEELEERLLNLLIERIKSEERSLTQIILDEALHVLPKLTNEQVDVLTLAFSIIEVQHSSGLNLKSLIDAIDNEILAFYPKERITHAFVTHLQYTGSCVILSGGKPFNLLEDIFLGRYNGVLNNGFTEGEFRKEIDENFQKYESIIVKCQQNPNNVQFNSMTRMELEQKINKKGLETKKNEILKLWDRSTMTRQEVKQFFNTHNPRFEDLSQYWKSTNLRTVSLTSVGLVIAILNFNKKTGSNLSIDQWLRH